MSSKRAWKSRRESERRRAHFVRSPLSRRLLPLYHPVSAEAGRVEMQGGIRRIVEGS